MRCVLCIFGSEQFEWRKASGRTAAGGIGSIRVCLFGNIMQRKQLLPWMTAGNNLFWKRLTKRSLRGQALCKTAVFLCFSRATFHLFHRYFREGAQLCFSSAVIAAGNSTDGSGEKSWKFGAKSSQYMWAKDSGFDL